MMSTNMERIPACIRKLRWNCCRKLLEAKKGKMYGFGTIADSRVVMMVHKREVTLTVRKKELEQDKIEKHAMMEKIEQGGRLYAEMNEKIQMLSVCHKTRHQLKMR
ncbi:hypothetical protein Hanom_Chr09g00832181 [Helianthus anomalus]